MALDLAAARALQGDAAVYSPSVAARLLGVRLEDIEPLWLAAGVLVEVELMAGRIIRRIRWGDAWTVLRRVAAADRPVAKSKRPRRPRPSTGLGPCGGPSQL